MRVLGRGGCRPERQAGKGGDCGGLESGEKRENLFRHVGSGTEPSLDWVQQPFSAKGEPGN